ncbi:hypothetical protein MBM_00737 [Drepanopeziza brunnea f. sp. 'multigermtubi' MB_m1]|uniref:Uncharacterized protein n=1 Tax=Marssonina brunnea f. sp. multigermtubi (strain MB_m1) TaxID=1072389 RepID=K1Y911_MARBU|nr:uncharacterized protein MBM_00737 [Drepanopeziza brunnea f. sp. 'multigermtubi' MB_m1]EKD21624.1 hypothetical protein MBM_00737 [Drepanopeziza brunnea f. sp. 'multigermtubi' MB_m1]
MPHLYESSPELARLEQLANWNTSTKSILQISEYLQDCVRATDTMKTVSKSAESSVGSSRVESTLEDTGCFRDFLCSGGAQFEAFMRMRFARMVRVYDYVTTHNVLLEGFAECRKVAAGQSRRKWCGTGQRKWYG